MNIEVAPRPLERSEKKKPRPEEGRQEMLAQEAPARQALLDRISLPNISPEAALATLVNAEGFAVAESATHQADTEQRLRMIEVGIRQLDSIYQELVQLESVEAAKERLRAFMEQMSSLAHQVPPEIEENKAHWEAIYFRFKAITDIKRGISAEHARQAFEDIFQEYSMFLENEFFDRAMQDKAQETAFASVEDLMGEFFARTPEEVEKLKEMNREKVVEYILQHKDDEPSVELLEALQELNNKGITPTVFLKIRGKGQEVEYGTGRVGTLGEDVREELEHVMARAEWLRARNVSTARYEISVAALHNDILNIHPLSDRNGSTAFLFMEFMMIAKGYGPSTRRETGYYNQVRKVLGNNPVAMAVLGGGQYEAGNLPGYYKGVTAKTKEAQYKVALENIFRKN